jgi:hypothetical protein
MTSGVYVRTEEYRKSLSLAKKGKPIPWCSNLGLHHTDEAKRKIAEYQKGKIRSEETRRRMSSSKIGQKPFLGRHHLEETKRKIGLCHVGNKHMLGKKHSDETKRKIAILAVGNIRNLGRKLSKEIKSKISLSKAIRIQKIKGIVGPYKGHMFRSKWELLVAKNLDAVGIAWEYEPQYFILKNGQTYTPDFKVDFGWLEVKGAWLGKAINKLNMFVEAGNDLFLIDGRNINNPDLYDAIPWEVR